jgi:hypothetical protein
MNLHFRARWFVGAAVVGAVAAMAAGFLVTMKAPSVIAGSSSTPAGASAPILEDNFDAGVIDTSKWSVEVARPGYGIWKLPELTPPFIQATEEGGQLRFAGNGYDYYDYTSALISKATFSGSFTLEVDLTSLSGSAGQWGAGVVIVKDDFTAIQLLEDVAHWAGQPSDYFAFTRIARGSCIDGTPGCPTSPGGLGTPEIDYGEVKASGATTFPTKLYVVYDGATRFDLYWVMSGQIYTYTHYAPEVYDTYRVALFGGAQLGSDYVDARFDNFRLLAGEYPPVGAVGGIAEFPESGGASVGNAAASTSGSGSAVRPYAALAGGLAAGVVTLTAGAWLARRRWLR